MNRFTERRDGLGRILYVSLNIKNDEAVVLARQLAAATGESVTRAVTVAVRERLARVRAAEEGEVSERVKRMSGIARDSAKRWVEPYRRADHGDLLYDENGLPR
jgi:antitoxin VapB